MLRMSDKKLDILFGDFVKNETSDRDPSHGYPHMYKVVQNTRLIMSEMKISEKQKQMAVVVAWLHDVADHKYDLDGSVMQKVEEFLNTILNPVDADYALRCVEYVSFSVEKRLGYKHYEKTLPCEWVVVRNIASDADKLEALGQMGIDRCKQYAREKSPVFLSDEALVSYIWGHAQEKMLLLYKDYIHTIMGKKLACPLHSFVVRWLRSRGISDDDLKQYDY